MTTVDANSALGSDSGAVPPVGVRLLLTLLAGRSIFRIVLYGANVVLLAAWTRAEFDSYAAASAGLTWVVVLTQAGPEKAALKLIPRAHQGREAITAGLVWGIRLVPVLIGGVAAAALALDPPATLTLYLVMAAQSAAVGCNVAAAGTVRALGRTRRDPRNFVVLSAGWVVATAFAVASSIDPITYLILQFLLAVGVTELTLAGVHAPLRALTARPRVLRTLAVTVALMGVQDVVACVAVSGVFIALTLTGHTDQSGALYVAVAGWAIVLGFFTYLLRVFQPRVSLRLADNGGRDVRAWSRSLGWWALELNGAWLIVVAATMRASEPSPDGGSTVLTLVALLASHTPVLLLTGLGLYLLENSHGDLLRVAATAAAANLAMVALVSIAVVPQHGAVGAVWALGAGELATAGVLVRQRPLGRSAHRVERTDRRLLAPVKG